MNLRTLGVVAVIGTISSAAFSQSYAAYTYGAGYTLSYIGHGQYGLAYTGTSFRFQAAASGTVTNISTAINDYSNESPTAFGLQLWTDSGAGSSSGVLGTELGSWSAHSSGSQYDSTPVSVSVSSGPVLTAGQWYWLTGTSTTPTELGWGIGPYANPNSYVLEGGSVYYDGSEAAYSITVNAVPEPQSLLPLGIASIGLLARRRIRMGSCKA